MLAFLLVVILGSGTLLRVLIGIRRDDRMHLEDLEDELLDQYCEHGLPDR